MARWIDAHTHLHSYRGEERARAIAEIREFGIRSLAVAMDLETYTATKTFAAEVEGVIPCCGVHPARAAAEVGNLALYAPYLAEAAVIGEIGLDRVWVDIDTYPAQLTVFEYFLAAARDLGKPVNLHTKGAEADILSYLRQYHINGALIHWYSGPWDVFEALVADGHYFTISVEVLYSDEIRAFAKAIPLPQLLLETDNPTGLPWLSGRDGMPAVITEVYEAVAALRGMSVEVLSEIVEQNLRHYLRTNAKRKMQKNGNGL